MKFELICPNRQFSKTVLELTLVEIHDTDDDHEVGGQDLPYRVTVMVEGVSLERALESNIFDKLEPFSIQVSKRFALAGHLEFCTFSGIKEIQSFFGIMTKKTAYEINSEAYSRRMYVRTVGELRSAIADLPDDFPLVHTGYYGNALGMSVSTGSWQFQRPGEGYGSEQWSLRLSSFDASDWERIIQGTWKNLSAKDLDVHLESLESVAKREISAMYDQAMARIEAFT